MESCKFSQKENRKISKNAIFTNGIFLFMINSKNMKAITYKGVKRGLWQWIIKRPHGKYWIL